MHFTPSVSSIHKLHEPRMLSKLENVVSELDTCHAALNTVYSEGAVEGFTPESLTFQLYSIKVFYQTYSPNTIRDLELKDMVELLFGAITDSQVRHQKKLVDHYKTARRWCLARPGNFSISFANGPFRNDVLYKLFLYIIGC